MKRNIVFGKLRGKLEMEASLSWFAMKKKNDKYEPGKHPNSLENLNRKGSTPVYEEKKKSHEVTVTESGWQGFKEVASEVGCSASELIDRIGRGIYKVSS